MCSIMGYDGFEIDELEFKKGFNKTISRGPDMSKIEKFNNCTLAFHRLAIMGLDVRGMQPFNYKNYHVVCNGEIYGFRKLKDDLIKKGYSFNQRATFIPTLTRRASSNPRISSERRSHHKTRNMPKIPA